MIITIDDETYDITWEGDESSEEIADLLKIIANDLGAVIKGSAESSYIHDAPERMQ